MKRISNLTVIALVSIGLWSCETDDVVAEPTISGPTVSLSSSASNLIEDNATLTVTASLSESLTSDVSIDLSFLGTATTGDDYTASGSNITIAAGALNGTITLTSVQDTVQEGNETIIVKISSVSGAQYNASEQVEILLEDDDIPLALNIIVNEILYDPSNNALDGDANGDGTYAQNEDEFIEFVNLSNQTVDMGGYKIYDTESLLAGTPSHIIPANTLIAPGQALVVFGGGTPTGTFGGATVQTSTSGDLNLNNSGDEMTLTDAQDNVVVTFDIEPLSNNPNESYTRNPDLTGDFEQHGTNTGLLFSPGTKIDGSPF